jgi:PAS domain S-box-containing protein
MQPLVYFLLARPLSSFFITGAIGVLLATIYPTYVALPFLLIMLVGITAHGTTRVLIPESARDKSLLNAPLADDAKEQLSQWRTAIERFTILLDNLAAAAIIRDSGGKITFCSPYTEVLTGFSRDEFYALDKDIFIEQIHHEDRERCLRALRMNGVGEPFQHRFRFFHKSGIEMWLESRNVPIIRDGGEVICSLSVVLDVTGLVRSQKLVEERNKDIQDFTSLLSHDLKAPLFTIKGMVEVLREELTQSQENTKQSASLSPQILEPLSHLTNSSMRLERLILALLEYAKVSAQELKQEPVDLGACINEAISDHQSLITTTHASITYSAHYPRVLGDPLKITQILSNLIGNALKYREHSRKPKLSVKVIASANPRYTTLEIKDNGIGIPEDKISLLFRPFSRIHPEHAEGTGIGLASVKKLVERLGGTITVSSVVGEGSTFKVLLRVC